ncbi:PglL family O-oligosaccharyltransferase [Enterobacter cloacae]|uniref:PglL family O-oligosaccharyltransferase n=1 Tax=Enterobacter cloacae TaxID=550 RepID=UPI0034A314C1
MTKYVMMSNVSQIRIGLACWGLVILLLSVLYLPNNGGSGLQLPVNLLMWSVVIAGAFCFIFQMKNVRIDIQCGGYYSGAAVLLTLPILWTSHPAWQINALQHVAGIWGAFILFMLLLQIPFSTCTRKVINFVLAATLLQVMLAFIQLYCPALAWSWMEYYAPHALRPYGIFQQVNVLASFLATGVGCAIYLLLTTRKAHAKWGYGLALTVLAYALQICHSRTGWAGETAVLVALSIPFLRRMPWRIVLALGTIMVGIALYHWLSPLLLRHLAHHGIVVPWRSYRNSTQTRWRILSLTWKMITEHPCRGWGYGSFEFLYTHRAAGATRTMRYPHNEFLYAWFEGGGVAAAGLVLMVLGWLLSMIRRSTLPLAQRPGVLGILCLPIMLHMMTEYPLYQSAIHLVTLVLLLRLLVPEDEIRTFPVSTRVMQSVKGVLMVLATGTVIFMLTALHTQAQLTRAERHGLVGFPEKYLLINPCSQYERWQFDNMVSVLLHYNKNHDPELLKQFTSQATAYLQVHCDANISYDLIRVFLLEGNITKARQYLHDARLLYPSQVRFQRLMTSPLFITN